MKALLDTLILEGLITPEQLQDAKDKQVGAKRPVQELLVEMDFIKEEDLLRVSSKVLNMPVANLQKEEIDRAILKSISYETAKRYGVFPVRKAGGFLILAMSNPQDFVALDAVSFMCGMPVKPILCARSQIAEWTEKHYESDDNLYEILKNFKQETTVEMVADLDPRRDAPAVKVFEGDESPIVRIVNGVLSDAVKARASDIHVEPQKDFVEIRYRIDGNLKSVFKVPRHLQAPLISRLKILSNLNIAEQRMAQDGRIRVLVGGRPIDLRVSAIPTFYGENVVLRVLDPQEVKVNLNDLGFSPEEMKIFVENVRKTQGIVLVTGPTGSGKTSTLYAALNFIKNETKNIVTIEDPIEYLIEGVSQMQIQPVKHVTFATGLKSILRQDPNVILVGEIRDQETAEMTFRASLTGHLVLSTLHTNSTVMSITRLLDIGLEPYLISSSLALIVAQRLMRLICPRCKEEAALDDKVKAPFRACIEQLNLRKFYRGMGCEQCSFTGYYRRTAVFEELRMNQGIKNLINQRASEEAVFQEAKKNGLKTLLEAGMEKVAQGLTTLEEVARISDIPMEEAMGVSPNGRKSEKILVADDEGDILKTIDRRLTHAGYAVLKARDGREAVELAVKERPDLIVTDLMMPQMDGFEVTKVLRSKLETAVIPIVMLTARADRESELKGLDVGADDYITKPFDIEKLLARIRMLLRRRVRV